MKTKIIASVVSLAVVGGVTAAVVHNNNNEDSDSSPVKETTATTMTTIAEESPEEGLSEEDNSGEEEQDTEFTLAPEEEEAKSTFTTTEWDGNTYDKVDIKNVNKVVYDKDNIKATITDIEAPVYDRLDGDYCFNLNITTENKTGKDVVVRLRNFKVNGKAVDMRIYSGDVLFKDDEDGSVNTTTGEKRHFDIPAYVLVEYYNINYSDIKTISFNVVAYKDDISDKYRIGTGDRIVLNLK